ncbi:hypothetical protein BGW36DRAFT_425222 [Talaromyces proteolyticus]|uniref:Uncharacterized protein n=1 Tax=Talaromyces proteolyticus TaxID=1131652 RepID=A0AAD4KYY1_9EURO|nr:uncharacterized protein BGW36DRAFT_425222 [Talaromyces proteolyticus]KAH8700395.1 hypothetical protein BGW36DRAFT_425222 [Talaromyces proteolyticus]
MSNSSYISSPPALNLSSKSLRKTAILWLLFILFENSLIPIALFFILGDIFHVKLWIIYTVIASIWGFALYVQFLIRLWKFLRRWKYYRPLSSTETNSDQNPSHPRLYSLDTTHWILLVALSISIAELIIATALTTPSIRVLSVVNQSMFLALSIAVFILDVGSWFAMRATFRVSSIARGEPLRPGLYTLVEDVMAVDAGYGLEFRGHINARWKASPSFRLLFQRLSPLWSVSGIAVNGVCLGVSIVLIDDTHGKGEAGFVIGFAVPYVWAFGLIIISVAVVKSSLQKERERWSEGG